MNCFHVVVCIAISCGTGIWAIAAHSDSSPAALEKPQEDSLQSNDDDTSLLQGSIALHSSAAFTSRTYDEEEEGDKDGGKSSKTAHMSSTANEGGFCPDDFQAVYADMADGDMKEITVKGTSLTIKPSGNNQTWFVKSMLDQISCSAIIDFNVPGKPEPPPVNLLATLWHSSSHNGKKTVFEFTDPSGTLAAKHFPVNQWVEVVKKEDALAYQCPNALKAVYADMCDGDKKEVLISGKSLTIKPSGNNQTWVVNSEVDTESCSASVNFDVPGKPNPPPVSLQVILTTISSVTTTKTALEFTDPSGTLAAPTVPLNQWVEISRG